MTDTTVVLKPLQVTRYPESGTEHIGPPLTELYSAEDVATKPHLEGRVGMPKWPAGSVFPSLRTIVSGPGIHAMRLDELLEVHPELKDKRAELLQSKVDYVVRGQTVYVRPRADMKTVFDAMGILENVLTGKGQALRYEVTQDEEAQQKIRERGDVYRMTLIAQGDHARDSALAERRQPLKTSAFYYWDPWGTRYCTLGELKRIATLPVEQQEVVAKELIKVAYTKNRAGRHEIVFFNTTQFKPEGTFADILRQVEERTIDRTLQDETLPKFRKTLFETVFNDSFLICEEKRYNCIKIQSNVKWLPGAHYDGQWRFHNDADDRVKGFIQNFAKDIPEMRWINIGEVVDPMSDRNDHEGRREVYTAELGGDGWEHKFLLRMQDYDMWQFLDEGEEYDDADFHADEHQNYILNNLDFAQRIGAMCEDLVPHVLQEKYLGNATVHFNKTINAHYVYRRWIDGNSLSRTPKPDILADDAMLLRYAIVTGAQIGINLVLRRGRKSNGGWRALFYDCDEYPDYDQQGRIAGVRLGDPTACFEDISRGYRAILQDYKEIVKPIFARGSIYETALKGAFCSTLTRIKLTYSRNPNQFKHFHVRKTGNPRRPEISETPDESKRRFHERMWKHIKAMELLNALSLEDICTLWD